MQGDTGRVLDELRVDGAASVMDALCQFQAALLGIPVRRPRQTETTALGAAFLAGLGAGVWTAPDLADLWKLDRSFEPAISRDHADALQAQWRRAVERSRAWSPSDNQSLELEWRPRPSGTAANPLLLGVVALAAVLRRPPRSAGRLGRRRRRLLSLARQLPEVPPA